jgi:hypothetical protein
MDSQTGKTFIDLSLLAQPGTGMARQLAKIEGTPTQFGGFLLPKAAVVASGACEYTAPSAEKLKQVFDLLRKSAAEGINRQQTDEAKAKVGREFVAAVLDVAEKTLASGKADGAASAVLDADRVQVVVGKYVADGGQLEKALKEVYEAIRQEQPAVEQFVKWDAEKVGDIRLHVISLPINPADANREKLEKVFGENVQIVVGFAPKGFYLATGKEPVAALKGAIEKSQQGKAKAQPMAISIDVGAIANFMATMGDSERERRQAAQLAKALQAAGEKDHVVVTVSSVERGLRLRLEAQEGLLKAAAQMRSQGRQPAAQE